MREGREAKEGRDVCIIMADLYGRNQYNIVNFFKYLNKKKRTKPNKNYMKVKNRKQNFVISDLDLRYHWAIQAEVC